MRGALVLSCVRAWTSGKTGRRGGSPLRAGKQKWRQRRDSIRSGSGDQNPEGDGLGGAAAEAVGTSGAGAAGVGRVGAGGWALKKGGGSGEGGEGGERKTLSGGAKKFLKRKKRRGEEGGAGAGGAREAGFGSADSRGREDGKSKESPCDEGGREGGRERNGEGGREGGKERKAEREGEGGKERKSQRGGEEGRERKGGREGKEGGAADSLRLKGGGAWDTDEDDEQDSRDAGGGGRGKREAGKRGAAKGAKGAKVGKEQKRRKRGSEARAADAQEQEWGARGVQEGNAQEEDSVLAFSSDANAEQILEGLKRKQEEKEKELDSSEHAMALMAELDYQLQHTARALKAKGIKADPQRLRRLILADENPDASDADLNSVEESREPSPTAWRIHGMLSLLPTLRYLTTHGNACLC